MNINTYSRVAGPTAWHLVVRSPAISRLVQLADRSRQRESICLCPGHSDVNANRCRVAEGDLRKADRDQKGCRELLRQYASPERGDPSAWGHVSDNITGPTNISYVTLRQLTSAPSLILSQVLGPSRPWVLQRTPARSLARRFVLTDRLTATSGKLVAQRLSCHFHFECPLTGTFRSGRYRLEPTFRH
jgi:hypothetical protein